jgi:hypothetical protein
MQNSTSNKTRPERKLIKDTYYWTDFNKAQSHMNKLISWQDATPAARVNSFGRGYAIQERRGGMYWGMTSSNCPTGGTFEAEGWV